MFFKKSQKQIEFPSEIQINQIPYKITITFSRKKNSSASVKDQTLNFRLSSYLSHPKAQEHFKNLLNRLTKQIQKSPPTQKKTIKQILNDAQFTFAGETYFLEYTKNRGVKLKQNTFHINFHTLPENTQKHITKLLIEKYTPRIKQYVNAINDQTYQYPIKEISLKLVHSKWGHCTHDNKILLNLKLLNTPPEILQYVTIHELAHIKTKNHSQKFWTEVKKFCPNYKVLKKTLKENTPQLFK